MKIHSIKKVEHFVPKGSCGTGYSEPDKFIVTYDDNKTTTVWIDIWYRPLDMIYEQFIKGMKEAFDNFNTLEAFNMYIDEVAETSCPYTKEQLKKYYCL